MNAVVRVAVDCEPVGRDQSGNDMYLRGLLYGFGQLAQSARIELVLVGHPELLHEHIGSLAPNLAVDVLPWGRTSDVTWGRRARRLGCTVAVANYVPPIALGLPVVTILHDASWRHHPSLFPRTMRLRLETTSRFAARVSSALVTTAEATAADLRTQFPRAATKVVAIGGAGNPALFEIANRGEVADSVDRRLRDPFVFTVANLHPRKNLATLAAACSRAGIRLRVAGRPVWGESRPVGPEYQTTEWLGRVDDLALAEQYERCAVVVYPSLFEGFGMPLVEAMYFGAPIIASDIPTSREVLGDSGEYFPPMDASTLGSKLVDLLGQSDQLRRMSVMSRERGAEFRWSDVASRLATAAVLADGYVS